MQAFLFQSIQVIYKVHKYSILYVHKLDFDFVDQLIYFFKEGAQTFFDLIKDDMISLKDPLKDIDPKLQNQLIVC